jgi:two-component system sensor histidine kinase TtrS
MSTLVAFLLLVAIISGLWVLRLNGKLKQVNFFVEQQNDMMLNSVSEGIYGVDTLGHCTFVNQSLTNITGWEEVDMIGKMQHDILHHTHADGSAHPSDECPVYQTFKDGITRFVREDVFWKKNGDSFFVEYSVTPVKDTFGNITGSVVVFRDITDRLEQKQLEQTHRDELEHINRLNTMGELVTGIAHELNQPLTAIATSAFASSKMIEAGKCSTEKLLDVFEVISLQAEHAAGVIRHMRKLSDKAQVERSMIDINDRIKNVVTLISTNIKDAHIKLALNLTTNIPEFLAQPIQIDQALINLCKNAIDSMVGNTSSRVLTISTKVSGKTLEILIADTGDGIDSEMQRRLFESFASQKKDGMGLGLSITRSIIERHYGNLYLLSTSKKGSTFIINLPLEMNKT